MAASTRTLSRALPVGASAATIVGLASFFDGRSKGAEKAQHDTTKPRHTREAVSLLFSGGQRSPSPWRTSAAFALCEAPVPAAPAKYQPKDPAEPVSDPPTVVSNADDSSRLNGGMKKAEEGSYHGLFPARQLWRPNLEYPLWDPNWDGRRPPPILQGDDDGIAESRQRERYIRKNGVTRHIILIRHGQYDETHKEDSKRLLTPLGRRQAELTGRRLGEMIRGAGEEFGPCRVRVVRVSNLARAKETAGIIYENMGLEDLEGGDAVVLADPDPLLNEGRPSVVERTDEQHPRIEEAFRKYFYRADAPKPEESESEVEKDDATEASEDDKSKPKHEFEIIVCHANVIRYFFCRALQLPPEAWLRLCTFNCSLTYLTVRPTGTVSCRMLGDIGHLPYGMSTFSMHPGFNW